MQRIVNDREVVNIDNPESLVIFIWKPQFDLIPPLIIGIIMSLTIQENGGILDSSRYWLPLINLLVIFAFVLILATFSRVERKKLYQIFRIIAFLTIITLTILFVLVMLYLVATVT